jgi:Ankyrin repeats (many copies)/Ankyrin repeats (3 copies)
LTILFFTQKKKNKANMTTAEAREFISLVGYGPYEDHESLTRLEEFFYRHPEGVVEAPIAMAIQHRCSAETLRFLLSKGCHVDKKEPGHHAHTPLSIAVRSGRTDLVDLLLASGANPFKKNGSHRTPVIVFASQLKDNTRVIQRLLQHDPHQINDTDGSDVSALRSAAKYGNVDATRLLLARGADPTLADKKGYTPLAMCQCDTFFPAFYLLDNVETILRNRRRIARLLEEEDRAYVVYKGYAIADAHLVVEYDYARDMFSILHLPDVLKKRICRGKVLPQVVYTAQGYRTHPASPVVIHRATIVQEVLYDVWAKLTHDVFGDLMGYLV